MIPVHKRLQSFAEEIAICISHGIALVACLIATPVLINSAFRPGDAWGVVGASMILRDLCADDYDALFYPGGHGPWWDLAEDRCSIALIDTMYAQGKPVSAVCHAPGVLRHAKAPDGSPLVQGKQVTGFSNSEEAAVGLTDVVPFLVEDELQKNGGNYSKGADW